MRALIQSLLENAESRPVKITLNGDPFELPAPITVSALLAQLELDSRRVAVEHNLIVLKRAAFDTVEIRDGDQVEIVNFVGGGSTGGIGPWTT